MSFAEPIWLYLLPGALILLALFYLWAERRGQRRLGRFAASQLVAALTASYSRPRQIVKMSLTGLAVSLLFVSLARPQYGFVLEESEARGLDILFALDTSRSMLAEDVAPDRLARSKLAILDLVEDLRGDEVGLVAFAGEAFLQCPLTLDYDAFRQTLAATDTTVIPSGGTDLAAAIGEAAASFGSQESEKLLVLITDGEDLEASGIAAAREAADEGVRIFTVGVGTSDGEPIPITNPDGSRDYVRDAGGQPVRSALDESTLQAIAAATEGLYVPLGTSGGGLRAVYDQVRELFPEMEQGMRMQQIPLERYQWPLGVAVLLLLLEPLLGTRRRGALRGSSLILAFVLGAALFTLPASPLSASPQQALEAYQTENYTEAVELYSAAVAGQPGDARLQYNYGNALYRLKEYQAARDAFQAALRTDNATLQADAFFNLGNALYQLGAEQPDTVDGRQEQKILWEESLAAYRNAGALEPESPDVPLNLQLVDAALDRITDELTITPEPAEGGRVEPAGGRFVHGSSINLEASPAEGWMFRQWEGGLVDAPEDAGTRITLNGDTDLVARFVRTWQLNVETGDAAKGTAGESGRYPEDQPVAIKAESKDHYTFKAWEAEGVEIGEPHAPETEITLTQDATVTATFQDAFLLSVAREPEIGGSAGQGGWYPVNADVPIQAEAREGFVWTGWLGEGVAEPTAGQTSVHLDRNRTVTAEFERVWNLIVIPETAEAGTAEGSSDEPIGSSVPIKATPNEGYRFAHWEGPGVGEATAAETTVTIQSDEHDVIAVFTPDENQNQDQDNNQDQNQNDDGDSDSSRDPGESSEDAPEDPEQEESDPREPEPGEDEAPDESEPSGEDQPEEESQEQTPPEEQASGEDPEEQEMAADAEAEAMPVSAGPMTEEQARQLLNALRESEQKLPAAPRERGEARTQGRDW